MKIVLKGALCGLVYAVFYELALAARWFLSGGVYWAGVAVLAGVIIGISIRSGSGVKTFAAVGIGLLVAFGTVILIGATGLRERVFLAASPELERMAVNDKFTAGAVTLGYLAVSLLSFILTLSLSAGISEIRREKISEMKNDTTL